MYLYGNSDYETTSVFFSAPSNSNIDDVPKQPVFDTGDERALLKAIENVFLNYKRLTCTRHIRENKIVI